MNRNQLENFKDQLWLTRISRVNAERRVQQKEKFIQTINVYYSCATIIFSILSYVNKDNALSLITIFMSISMLIAIMYLNSQKYLELARDYRSNYTQIQKLEFRLNHLNEEDVDSISNIEKEYCELLDSYNNHSTYDYYCAIANSNGDFKSKKGWNKIAFKYYFETFLRLIIKFSLIILPFLLYFLRGVL